MPQAIQTKYLPATSFKGSRIKAWCERGSITIDYPGPGRASSAVSLAAEWRMFSSTATAAPCRRSPTAEYLGPALLRATTVKRQWLV